MEPKTCGPFQGTADDLSALLLQSNNRREVMRKMALGLVAAAAVFTAVPAMAQVGFYAGPGGVGVGFGAPGPYYNSCGYDYPCGGGYYDYYNGPDVVIGGGGWHGGGRWHGGGGWHGHHGGGHRR
jgi:hypothetical protein